MKSKSIPQTRMQKIISLRPLLLAAWATFISLMLRAYTNHLDIHDSYVIYLVGIANFDVLALIAIGINVIVIAFYIRAIANVEQGSFAKLGLTALLFFASVGSFGHAITHKGSLRLGQATYHLVVDKDSGEGASEYTSYVMLACDSIGVSCRFAGRPFTTYTRCFQDKATLDYDSMKGFMLIWERYDEERTSVPFRTRDRSPLVECDDNL